MNKRIKPALAIFLIASSCSGVMNGTVRGEGTPVQFNYEQGASSDTYSTKIDGEMFSGKAVPIDATATFGTAFGSAFSGGYSAFGNSQGYGISAGGKFKAVLLGNKGATIRCLMQYADQMGFTSSGGVGECEHSDGRKIDIVW